jgi:hypothetical protein
MKAGFGERNKANEHPFTSKGGKKMTRNTKTRLQFLILLLVVLLAACTRVGAPLPLQEDNEGELHLAAVPTICNGSTCYNSLQAAIDAASAGDTITLGAGELTEAGIQLTKDLTIRGSASGQTIVQAAATPNTASNRVFTINGGVTATLQNLTIRHGVAPDHGGGILNDGTLTVQRSTIRDNTTGNGGSCTADGASVNCRAGDGGHGGGIYNNGTLTVDRSTIRDNTTGNGGSCTGEDSSGCHAGFGGYGGGITNWIDKTMTLTNSTLSGNRTGSGGSCSDRQFDCRSGLAAFTILALPVPTASWPSRTASWRETSTSRTTLATACQKPDMASPASSRRTTTW